MTPERRLAELGVRLPEGHGPAGSYVAALTCGSMVTVAGHPSIEEDGRLCTGVLGRDLDVAGGRRAAQLAALHCLSSLRNEIGELARVRQVVRVFGMLQTTPDFVEQPAVLDGCSDLLVAVFGDRGRHARSVAGVAALPFSVAVEIEMTVLID